MQASNGISLLDVLRQRGSELALIATYNVHFPFFEQVVLRRLWSGGCRYVVLLVDSGQLTAAMQQDETRPQLAGRQYGILPVRAPGAFHPKFVMLLGKERSRLLVGSHNLTLSGFGLNREVTTLFESEGDSNSRAPLQATWKFASDWVSPVAAKHQELLKAFLKVAPWLAESSLDVGDGGPWVLGSSRSGSTLWSQLRPFLDRQVDTATLLGPSFDEDLEFVKAVRKEIQPRALIIPVDPRTFSITPRAKKKVPEARFVDISANGWPSGHHFVHAKVHRFRFKRGGELLVSGSANPSRQAWTAPPNERNAELVVVQRLGPGDKLGEDLGLDQLTALPDLSAAGWKEVAVRQAEEPRPEREHEHVELAVPCGEGFLVPEAFVGRATRDQVSLVLLGDRSAAADYIEGRSSEALIGVRDRRVRDSAIRVEVSLPRSSRLAIIQRVGDLLEDAFNDTRGAIRNALSGLEGDPTQLEELLRVVEKALFEPPATASRAPAVHGTAKSGTDSSDDGLSISIADGLLTRRIGQARVGRDIGALLDAFISRLGPLTGATPEPSSGSTTGEDTPEEEESPADGPPPPDDTERPELIDLCRKKMRQLIRRLLQRLEECVKTPGDAVHAVVQLAAALGVVHYLRSNEERFSWRPAGEDLVHLDDRAHLLAHGVRLLLAPRNGLAGPALKQAGLETFDELSRARALLCWLGFDCGYDLGVPYEFDDQDDDTSESFEYDLVVRGFLLHAVSEVEREDASRNNLEELLKLSGEQGARWFDRHMQLADALRRCRSAPPVKPITAEELEAGDLVYPSAAPAAPATVVFWANAQKAGVLDIETGDEKQFVLRYLARANLSGWKPVERRA